MTDQVLENRIAALQKEITANAREVIRLHQVIEAETRELLQLETERDGGSGFTVFTFPPEYPVLRGRS